MTHRLGRTALAAAGALAAVVALAVNSYLSRPAPADAAEDKDPPKAADKGPDKPADKRDADRDAVRQASAEFVKALEKGDAKALAALWTEEGEYTSADGMTLRGRDAIEAAYAKFFAKKPNLQLEIVPESVRFPSRDSAVEEGYAKRAKGKAGEPTTSRYSTLYVRENGKWLLAILREWPDEGLGLRDLDWLVGTWTAKTDDGEVRTTYEWTDNKAFIRMNFTGGPKDHADSGMQMIGKDPRTSDLHSWLFEGEGGFGDGDWSWDGKRWVIKATGVTSDGAELTATNILTPIDKDTFTWQSTERTLNGDDLPDIAPIKVTRAK
jgi:uncharacterized protein (TIGR02246 family)